MDSVSELYVFRCDSVESYAIRMSSTYLVRKIKFSESMRCLICVFSLFVLADSDCGVLLDE